MPEKNGTSPLVSIIIRSMDRPTLVDALDSVALQTYTNIEAVVVNAKGSAHGELGNKCGCFPLRLIESDGPLSRCRAANMGLKVARGEFLIFLDDDDLFYPDHIAHLIMALQAQNDASCAYAGVKVEYYVANKLEKTSNFNEPFDKRRLWGRNFIPIHAMLFAKSLVTDGCRFDESLEIFEDWDFWMQLAQHSEILHIDKISAIYRNYGHSGMGLTWDENALHIARGKVIAKWKILLTGEQLDSMIQYREDMITTLRNQSAHDESIIVSLQQNKLLDTERIVSLQQNILLDTKRAEALQETIHDFTHSTSWKITRPLRFLARMMRGQHREALAGLRRKLTPLLKKIYWRVPMRWRNRITHTIYRVAGRLFVGMSHYEAWRINPQGITSPVHMDTEGFLAGVVDLPNTAPLADAPPGRIAIHCHIFYADLAAEFAKYLRYMPYSYDLYVSTPNEEARSVCTQAFSALPRLGQLTVTIVPNRGRDIAPFFCTFGGALQQYDYIAHLHSKKSLFNNGATDGWREYLLNALLGNKLQIQQIFTLLTIENTVGFVYPQNFSELPYVANSWLSNLAIGRLWCNKLGITLIPTGYFDFPAGSMFWARTQALKPLFDAHIKIEDFPEENGQNDATLAHCIERLFVLVTKKSGFNAIILRDIESRSWSRWRFEQYVSRRKENIQAILADPALRIVIFDIFDTLLTRPLLNPESIKQLIAQRAGAETGQVYLECRATAEHQARQKATHDVGLDAIFEEFTTLSGLSLETVKQLRDLEETIELEAVSPRPEAIELLQSAATLGKHIILASDMYLPKTLIEKMLAKIGVKSWQALYLSSDNGLRKDTGDFYRHILQQENVAPDEILMIGDNEHSDVQIPGDMDINYLHILRPVELARAMPRLGPLVERALNQGDLNQQLTLGAIAQRNFQPLFFPRFDPNDFVPATPWAIGFSVAGPLVLSFIQWLIAKATADDIQRLYFLSREGQILKMVYDRWVSNGTHAIAAEYLVLSRRTVTVPMIENFEDIRKIAYKHFHENHLATFIQERYGLDLSAQDCTTFARLGVWPKDKLVVIENEKIDHLIPVLQALEERILAQARKERPGLLSYLNTAHLNSADKSAIVDIGYAATIQGYLNRLTNKPIHGYYLMTEERAKQVATQHDVIIRGCFEQNICITANLPPIFIKSFSLEKLLSSNDAQIVCYQQEDASDPLPEFRQLSDEEHQSMLTRAEIRHGMMDFVDQAIMIRDTLNPDFTVPTDTAAALFETFIEHPSATEKEILATLVLDDYYCGRGLVS